MANWQQTAKITEVAILANRLGSKRCEKYWVLKGPIIGRKRTTREKSRSRKVRKSFRMNCFLHFKTGKPEGNKTTHRQDNSLTQFLREFTDGF